jgi:restriction endonuclease Mrr
MAIPKYYEMYEPFLSCLKDGLTHNIKEIKQYVADTMKISADDRKVLLSRCITLKCTFEI